METGFPSQKRLRWQRLRLLGTDTTLYVDGSGYSHIPEVGNVLIKLPIQLKLRGSLVRLHLLSSMKRDKQFILTVDTAIGALTTDDILVEAADSKGDVATAAATDATVLVKTRIPSSK